MSAGMGRKPTDSDERPADISWGRLSACVPDVIRHGDFVAWSFAATRVRRGPNIGGLSMVPRRDSELLIPWRSFSHGEENELAHDCRFRRLSRMPFGSQVGNLPHIRVELISR